MKLTFYFMLSKIFMVLKKISKNGFICWSPGGTTEFGCTTCLRGSCCFEIIGPPQGQFGHCIAAIQDRLRYVVVVG